MTRDEMIAAVEYVRKMLAWWDTDRPQPMWTLEVLRLADVLTALCSEPPTPAPFKPSYNREGAHATFNGGWQDEETRRAFHHGMDTVFNIIEKDALAPTPAPADLFADATVLVCPPTAFLPVADILNAPVDTPPRDRLVPPTSIFAELRAFGARDYPDETVPPLRYAYEKPNRAVDTPPRVTGTCSKCDDGRNSCVCRDRDPQEGR